MRRIIPRFRYEDHIFNFYDCDLGEVNLSNLISSKKEIVLNDKRVQVVILEEFEPTEIM